MRVLGCYSLINTSDHQKKKTKIEEMLKHLDSSDIAAIMIKIQFDFNLSEFQIFLTQQQGYF